MKSERLMTIIKAPIISEKTVMATEKNNAYVFKVLKNANKKEIKKAVELNFSVSVKSVRTSVVNGKSKRHGAQIGRLSSWKKASVTLVDGQSIEIMDTE